MTLAVSSSLPFPVTAFHKTEPNNGAESGGMKMLLNNSECTALTNLEETLIHSLRTL